MPGRPGRIPADSRSFRRSASSTLRYGDHSVSSSSTSTSTSATSRPTCTYLVFLLFHGFLRVNVSSHLTGSGRYAATKRPAPGCRARFPHSGIWAHPRPRGVSGAETATRSPGTHATCSCGSPVHRRVDRSRSCDRSRSEILMFTFLRFWLSCAIRRTVLSVSTICCSSSSSWKMSFIAHLRSFGELPARIGRLQDLLVSASFHRTTVGPTPIGYKPISRSVVSRLRMRPR